MIPARNKEERELEGLVPGQHREPEVAVVGEEVGAGVDVRVDQAAAADVQCHDLEHPFPERCHRVEGFLLHFCLHCGISVLVDSDEEDRLPPVGAACLDELVLGFPVQLFAGPDQSTGWRIGFDKTDLLLEAGGLEEKVVDPGTDFVRECEECRFGGNV